MRKSIITNDELEELRDIKSSVRIIEMPELFKEVHNGEHCEFCKNKGKDNLCKK